MLQSWMIPSDLAPGDQKSLERDWSDVTLHNIESAEDPEFDVAFGALWSEFGASSEVEQPAVLSRRLYRSDGQLRNGCALLYDLMLVTSNGQFCAVRDHTAIVPEDVNAAFVHLSHNLVAPDWRRSGLAGWLRALPIQTARRGLAAQNKPLDSPITLVAEMEYPNPESPGSLVRLMAYERAGYLKVDGINYLQPDFRAPEEIDLHGSPHPLPFTLLIRQVGHEQEKTVSGAKVSEMVDALYRMYSTDFRERDMKPLWESLSSYPPADAELALVPPTTGAPACP